MKCKEFVSDKIVQIMPLQHITTGTYVNLWFCFYASGYEEGAFSP